MNVIKFERDHSFTVTPLGLGDDRRADLRELADAVLHGQQPHFLGFAKKLISSLEANAAHMTRMREMVEVAVEMLHAGDDDFGHLLHESWTLKRSLADGTSTTTIDRIYDDALRAGRSAASCWAQAARASWCSSCRPDRQAGGPRGAVASHHGADLRRLHRLDDRLQEGRAARQERLPQT